MENNNVTFGNGIKIWVILCIIAGIRAVGSNFSNGFIPLAIVGIAVIALHVWLLMSKKRLPFLLIVAVAVITTLINIVVYKIMIVFALLGLVNPLITYAFLAKYWKQMD